MFVRRSLSSDQNFVAKNSGDALCARAIVRVVPNIRWDPDRISKIHMTPMDFRMSTMDRIEEETEPHAHPDPKVDSSEAQRAGFALWTMMCASMASPTLARDANSFAKARTYWLEVQGTTRSAEVLSMTSFELMVPKKSRGPILRDLSEL